MSYTAFSHGLWTYNITDKNIPGGILNTTCKNMCIGKLIPQFSHAQYDFSLRKNKSRCRRRYQVLRHKRKGKIRLLSNTERKYIDDYIDNGKQRKGVCTSSQTSNQRQCERLKIGQLSGFMLDFIVKNIIKTFMEPMLNDLGRNGFPLPIIGSVHFANTELHVQQNSLLIATDVKYY
uniref:Lipid-binding serum glycoprotein C-terminal domain-containing protein n=1 Tax=Magallana gigas TaxID=29159 RepID=A0A8W8JZJ4_MAGGI